MDSDQREAEEIMAAVTLQPFEVPHIVTASMPVGMAHCGRAEGLTFKLSALDEETLDRMCAEYRARVFKRAGKIDPALIHAICARKMPLWRKLGGAESDHLHDVDQYLRHEVWRVGIEMMREERENCNHE